MNYIINEYQTTNGTTAIVTPATSSDAFEAESIYHSRLSSAAISSVPIHAVTLDTEDGQRIASKCYKHGQQE